MTQFCAAKICKLLKSLNFSGLGAPSDTHVWKTGDCSRRALRGGSWDNLPGVVRSASRIRFVTEIRYSYFGFRIVRTLP